LIIGGRPVAERAGDEWECNAEREQAEADLEREGDGKNVQLRCRAAEYCERRVTNHYSCDDRSGEPESGQEQRTREREKIREARVQIQSAAHRHGAEARGERLDHAEVHVEREKNRYCKQREEIGEHRRRLLGERIEQRRARQSDLNRQQVARALGCANQQRGAESDPEAHEQLAHRRGRRDLRDHVHVGIRDWLNHDRQHDQERCAPLDRHRRSGEDRRDEHEPCEAQCNEHGYVSGAGREQVEGTDVRHEIMDGSERNSSLVYLTMIWMIHGSAMMNVTATATSLGTNESVCSWICVTAWMIEITRPTASATTSIGDAIRSAVMIMLRARSTTRTCDML